VETLYVFHDPSTSGSVSAWPVVFSPWLYKKRDLIERFFNKLKCYRRVATRYDKLEMTFLAITKLACIRITLRHNESTT